MSQGFLIKLADEEWTRLRAYEATGEVVGIGPVRREFDWLDPGIGCSARALHECLARYWEIIAFGPAQVISLEWQRDRTAAHPDFQQAWKEARPATPENASSAADVYMAMLMIGGEYAAPFMAAVRQFGSAATFVFPWLAHLALTTDRPTASYAMLTNECGHELANEVSAILDDSAIPVTERYESAMVLLGRRAHLAFLRTLPHDSMTGYGLTAYSRSHLRTNRAYAATFEVVDAAASALATTATVRSIARQWGLAEGSTKGLFIEGVHLLESAMATPGLETSRMLLQLAGLAPAVGYSNGEILPLGMVWRAGALANAEELGKVDVFRELVKLASRPTTSGKDRSITRHYIEAQARWDAFERAERDRDPAAHTGG